MNVKFDRVILLRPENAGANIQLSDQWASGNVEDRRGMGKVGCGLGVGGIVIAVIAYFSGFDAGAVLNMAEQVAPSVRVSKMGAMQPGAISARPT